jgi:hypothetical protein
MRCKQAATKVSKTGELSLEELTQFDGKEGREGYIATAIYLKLNQT